jgi:hypothetical protein
MSIARRRSRRRQGCGTGYDRGPRCRSGRGLLRAGVGDADEHRRACAAEEQRAEHHCEEQAVAVGTALRRHAGRVGPPPAQIRACAANALSSCLGYERQIDRRVSPPGQGCMILGAGSHRCDNRCNVAQVSRPRWLRRESAWLQWRSTWVRKACIALMFVGDGTLPRLAADVARARSALDLAARRGRKVQGEECSVAWIAAEGLEHREARDGECLASPQCRRDRARWRTAVRELVLPVLVIGACTRPQGWPGHASKRADARASSREDAARRDRSPGRSSATSADVRALGALPALRRGVLWN